MIFVRKKLDVLHKGSDVLNYINSKGLKLDDVAPNLATRKFGNGMNSHDLFNLLKNGVSESDARKIKKVVDILAPMKKKQQPLCKNNKKPNIQGIK